MRRIEDLLLHPESERTLLAQTRVPDFRRSILTGLASLARRQVPTRAEQARIQAEAPLVPCTECSGFGVVRPPLRHVGGIHPSSAYKCITRLYYDVLGTEPCNESLDVALLLAFEIGHAIHKVFEDVLTSVYPNAFQSEVPVSLPEAMVEHGHADGVYDDGQVRCLLEFKTASGNSFAGIRAPTAPHRLQTALYAKALDTPFVCILYLNKEDPGTIKQFIEPYNPDILNVWMRDVLLPLEQALGEGRPPPRNVPPSTCKQCGYQQVCPYSNLNTLTRAFHA